MRGKMKLTKEKDPTVFWRRLTMAGILMLCLLTAVFQGIPALQNSPKQGKILLISIVFLLYAGFLFYLRAAGKLKVEAAVFAVVLFGVLFRCAYVLLTGLYERQHDAGAFTGRATAFVNAGHIGYAEYIYKFGYLPRLNPYQLFAYYHPPLHHILSALWLSLQAALGVAEANAFENLQILTLLYSCLCIWTTERILRKLHVSGTGLCLGVFLVAAHPSFVIMAGSVNNDMLSVLFIALCIYAGLCWLEAHTFRNLMGIALCIGLGMITKLTVAAMAFPVGFLFLLYLIRICKSKDRKAIRICLIRFAVFGLICGVIGLSWVLRNLVLYGENPGVPVPGVTSPMYTQPFSWWQRFGIPAPADWHFEFPFHPISARAGCNTWVIMFQTALYGEVFPAGLPGFVLAFAQIAYALSILTAVLAFALFVITQVKMMRGGRKENSWFLLIGYFTYLLSFPLFAVKYPYTCSCDFRYIIVSLFFMAAGIGQAWELVKAGERKWFVILTQAVTFGILVTLTLTTVVFATWNQL